MAVARVTEISSTSTKSFEDAIQSGVARATKTLQRPQRLDQGAARRHPRREHRRVPGQHDGDVHPRRLIAWRDRGASPSSAAPAPASRRRLSLLVAPSTSVVHLDQLYWTSDWQPVHHSVRGCSAGRDRGRNLDASMAVTDTAGFGDRVAVQLVVDRGASMLYRDPSGRSPPGDAPDAVARTDQPQLTWITEQRIRPAGTAEHPPRIEVVVAGGPRALAD